MAKNESLPQVNEVSRISVGTEIKGNMISQTDIRIDGTLEGNLTTRGKLVLGENAIIKGNVVCLSADVWGKITGELIAGDTVNFKSSASFEGELKTVRIGIEIGAKFTGSCCMITEQEYKTRADATK